jgi:small nuclear ribonucleoprotein (snRNP)-like protein
MTTQNPSSMLRSLVGEVVIVDLASTYVCIGTLAGVDELFLDLRDADLHDFRDGSASREVYVYEAATLGVRRNRDRLLLRIGDVVAVSALEDVSTS